LEEAASLEHGMTNGAPSFTKSADPAPLDLCGSLTNMLTHPIIADHQNPSSEVNQDSSTLDPCSRQEINTIQVPPTVADSHSPTDSTDAHTISLYEISQFASSTTDTSSNTTICPPTQELPSLIHVHPGELYMELPSIPMDSCTDDSSSLNVHLMINRRKARTHIGLVSSCSTPLMEPRDLSSALQSPHCIQAMRDELTTLHQQHMWDLVPRHDSMNIVGSQWVFKTKLKSDGSIERFKARLVAKGYSQLEGIDFTETLSPVIKPITIRLVLSLAISHGWSIR